MLIIEISDKRFVVDREKVSGQKHNINFNKNTFHKNVFNSPVWKVHNFNLSNIYPSDFPLLKKNYDDCIIL